MQDEEFSSLRNSLRRSTALRVAEHAPPRVVEPFPQGAYGYPPPPSGLSFWQWCGRVIPILVAILSSGLLAYFLLFHDRSQLLVVPQQAEQKAQQPRGDGPSGDDGAAVDGSGSQDRQAQAETPTPQAQVQPEPEPKQQGAQQPPTIADTGPKLPMPGNDKLVILITASILALNEANVTGNYTVLREGAAPAFQQQNSPERTPEIFKGLRSRKLDLSPIIVYTPKLFRAPEMNGQGLVRVTGFFPTEPERVNFDLIYQPVPGNSHYLVSQWSQAPRLSILELKARGGAKWRRGEANARTQR